MFIRPSSSKAKCFKNNFIMEQVSLLNINELEGCQVLRKYLSLVLLVKASKNNTIYRVPYVTDGRKAYACFLRRRLKF
jgi:hypothetical protein